MGASRSSGKAIGLPLHGRPKELGYAYSIRIHVFTTQEIEAALTLAREFDLELTGTLSCVRPDGRLLAAVWSGLYVCHFHAAENAKTITMRLLFCAPVFGPRLVASRFCGKAAARFTA
jgi:hypothetical protein